VLKDRLVGAWALVSLETRRSDGTTAQPLGPSPAGRFLFDPDGNFAAQSMDPGGPDGQPAGYTGLWGTYEVDEDEQAFILTFLGTNLPGAIGQRTVRHVTFTGGVAVFSTDPQPADGLTEQTFITWQKISPATTA
jgi:hypothetical protein